MAKIEDNPVRDRIRNRLEAESQKQSASLTQFEPVKLENVEFDPYDQKAADREKKQKEAFDTFVNMLPSSIPGNYIGNSVAQTMVSGITPYTDNSGNVTNYLEQFKNINVRDALQISLSSATNEFREQEGKWLPELQVAEKYLEAKNNLYTLDQKDPQNYNKIQEALATVQELEPEVKDFAITNPYLRDIFYAKKNYYGPTGMVTGSITPDYYTSTDNFAKGNRSKFYEDDMWNAKQASANINDQLQQLSVNRNELQNEYSDKETDIRDKYNGLTTAHYLHDPLFGIIPTPFYYDPSKIDTELDRRRSEEEISLLNPLSWKYGLLHLGSSYSEMQAMTAQMALSLALRYGTKLAAGYASGGTLPLLLVAGEQTMNLGFTNYFREKETASEVMSNYVDRILESSKNGNIDLNHVLDSYDAQLKDKGYDTTNMDEMTKLELGLAYNFNTGDQNFNKIVEDSAKGLEDLAAVNNALSLSDYLENFGLSYTGKQLTRSLGSGLKSAAGTIWNKVPSKAKDLLNNRLTQYVRKKVNRAADKAFENVGNRLKYNHVLNTLKGMGVSMGKRVLAERTEEGIQYLAGQKYKAGLYDEPNSYSFLKGVVEDGLLGVEANLAYYGLHPDDQYNTDEQLKRNMEIGGFVGMMMGGVASSANDLIDLRNQLRADERIRRIAADGYEKAENTFKAKIFLDAARKNRNTSYLLNSLEDMKKYKPEGVTDEMIDEDASLVKDVFAIYNNIQIDENMRKMEINRKKDQSFEDFVVANVDVSNRYKKANKSYRDSAKAYDDFVNGIINDDSDSVFNNILKQEYNYYAVNEKSPIEFKTFKTNVLNALLIREQRSILNQLKKDLNARKKSIQQLGDEQGLDVNLNDITSIIDYLNEYYKKHQEAYEKLGGQNTFKKTKISIPDVEEIRKLFAAQVINGAITDALLVKNTAYATGRLDTKYRTYFKEKPLFSNLSPEQQEAVLKQYAEKIKQQKKTDKEPSRKAIIAKYNLDVQQEWYKMEQSANVEENERFLANMMFQEDINKIRAQRQTAQQEINEQFSTETAQKAEEAERDLRNQQSQQANQYAEQQNTFQQPEQPQQDASQSQQQPTEDVKEQAEEQPSQMQGDSVSETDAAIADSIDEQLDKDADKPFENPDEIQEISGDEVDEVIDNTKGNEVIHQGAELDNDELKYLREEEGVRILEDEDASSFSAQQERVENGDQFDLGQKEEVSPTSQEVETDQVTQQTEQEQGQTDQIESKKIPEEQKPTKTKQPPVNPTNEKEVRLTIESDIDADSQYFTQQLGEDSVAVYSNGEELWMNNPQEELGQPVTEHDAQLMEVFDMFDAMDAALSKRAREHAQTDKAPGLDTKKKVEVNRIHSTFFYNNSATEIMPIKTNGIDVKFNGVRRPGKELGEKLSIPGWLDGAKVYYIVTDSKNTHKDPDLLAIHMIIEKEENGQTNVYNCALRDVSRAEQILKEWFDQRDDLTPLEKKKLIAGEISKLRTLRRNIITQYVNTYAPDYFGNPKASLPTTAMDGVRPTGLRISNGSINNTVDGQDNPVFRPLTDVEAFGLSTDPYEMSEQISLGKVEFGYGEGPFSSTIPYQILHFDGETQTSAQGIGYAGKIYIIPNINNTPSRKYSAPFMLSEKRHFLGEYAKSFKLSYDNRGNATFDENGNRIRLTTAELIFRLMTATITLGSQELNDAILNILANTGSQTIIAGDDRAKGISFLIRKALHTYIGEDGIERLIYAEKAPEGYRLKYLPIRDIDGNLKFSEANAEKAIKHIAANIHWNTSKVGMSSPIPEVIRDEAIKYMEKYNTDYYRVLNCEELTFTMQDLGLTRENGKIVKVRPEAPLLLTWMINHQVIKTDVAPTAFKDPFVYADGVATVSAPKVEQSEVKAVPVVKEEVTEQPTQQEKPTEEKTQPKQESKNFPNGFILTRDEAIARGLKPKKGISFVEKNGKIINLQTNSPTAKKLFKERGIDPEVGSKRGVFSTVQRTGTVDMDKARQWLHDTLGIDKDDVFATTAVMKMGSAPSVYGVMEVVWDRLLKEFRPRIVLSEQAGEGIEYHEGYHYASLLILTEEQRNQVYSDYLKKHPEYREFTKTELEEVLAEEFRSYMLNEENPTLVYRIKKFFRTLKNLILNLAGKKIDYQSQLFEAIRKGNLKNSKVDQNTLEEFNKAYENGVHYYYPGIDESKQKNIPHITNANQLYTIVDSLTTTALQYSELRKKEDIETFSLDPVFEELQLRFDNEEYDDNPTLKQIVEDVLANKEIFISQIRRNLRSLGIKFTENEETEEQNKATLEDGNPDNIWDRASYEFSKKENVAFNAKLFFYSVPLEKFVTDEDGVRTRVPVTDGIFGLTKTVPFNITWNKILENLWNSNDWEHLLEKTRKLAEADPFFGTLLDIIDDPDYPLDEVTVTQLLTTIQSAKNSMDTVIVDDGTLSINSTNKVWKIEDSNNLRYIARLPQRWSNNFVLSSMVTEKDGKQFVSMRGYKVVKNLNDEITKNMQRIARMQDRAKAQELFDQAKNDFVKLVNYIGITFDVESLDYLLKKLPISKQIRPDIDGYDAFNLFYIKRDFNKKILDAIRIMAGSKTLEINNAKFKVSADRIFNTKDDTSHIALMAVAYGNINPSPEELSVTGAGGNLVYPISENNYMSDQIRWLTSNRNNKLDNLDNSTYAKHSLIVQALKSENKPALKLHTLIAFNEKRSGTSRDYFGISPMEDYIAKMFLSHNNRLILPTMSDKKTWYSISGLQLVKDALMSVSSDRDQDGVLRKQTGIPYRFSNRTLDIFCDYFLDEFNTIVEYYNNKSWVESDPTRYIANYHGKIGKNGKMKPGGNGGKFRYFNQLNVNGTYYSLNDQLTVAEESGDPQLVQTVLEDFRRLYISDRATLRQILNDTLQDQIKVEIERAISMGVIARNSKGMLINKNIPTNMFTDYNTMYRDNLYDDTDLLRNDQIYSMIANYTLNYMISIEELEKCFVGDPAFYKWKTTRRTVQTEVYDPITGGYVVIPVESVKVRDVDKIKRLSSVLSTGTNLRTTWGENDARNITKFTTVTMQDNMIGSDYHKELYDIFRASWIRTMVHREHPDYSDNKLFELTSPKNIEQTFDSLSPQDQKFVNKQAQNASNPYAYDDEKNTGEINQADAAVYIRPAFYKRILQSLGQWNDEVAEAFEILEADPDENGNTFLNNPELYAKSLKAAIHPLKMMYFGDHYNNKLGLNMPIFDKMALFPMFKCLAKADNKYLYQRMNDESLGTIDMMVFESASKVGSPAKKFRPYVDNKNTKFNTEDLFKPSSHIINSNGEIQGTGGQLTVQVQDISQLRLQLNTDPHHDVERSFGTQAVKICIGNVVDDRIYGTNKGKRIKGAAIKANVFGCIKALAFKGYEDIVGNQIKPGKLFTRGRLDNRKLSNYLIREASNTGMSQEIIEALKLNSDGEFVAPIASLSVRNWIESKIISMINKDVIDVNTPGGSAIQMSAFGFKANDVWTEENARPFNNGKKLSFDPSKGSMEVMLSIKFFKYIIPKEYQTDYNTMRNWLIDNNIINNPASNEQAPAFGIGYRIPTQGLSSTMSFIVADVLPEQVGDAIVVPDEFTAMTGSDFDVDKLYIATYDYDPKTHKRYEWDDTKENFYEQSRGALVNKLLDNYIYVISDSKTMSETRASIDTLTKILQKEILPLIDTSTDEEAKPFYELLPSFQESRKEEYTGGKAGIAPFALNSTNHCLTQATHLHMRYSHNNVYNLGDLDAIEGSDGFKILDWLSAMINAHVDVAKDPYIMTLNVNSVTYNITNLLLRGGKGRSTFYFLAQPILKEFTKAKIANNGIIGVNKVTDQDILDNLENKYFKQLQSLDNKLANEFKATDENANLAFDDTLLISALKGYTNQAPTAQDVMQQLIVLRAYRILSEDAQVLSDLVQRSQIDTKKYGNNISQLQNFYNSYTTFIKDNVKKFSTIESPENGLEDYFNKTFLRSKLQYALLLSNSILQNQVYSATSAYKTISTGILQKMLGGNYEIINSKLFDSQGVYLYKPTSNKDRVKKINDRIESVVRARVTANHSQLIISDEEIRDMLFGKHSIANRLNDVKQYIRDNRENPQLALFVNKDGTIANEMLNYLMAIISRDDKRIKRIVTVSSSMNNDAFYESRLTSAFYDLLVSEDNYVREFAEDLVKYAFYTSYDNRNPNSFFNLVPLEFKIKLGYTDAAKDAITTLNSGKLDEVANFFNFENPDNYIDSIYKTVIRNYWQDSDIVRTLVPRETRFEDSEGTHIISSMDVLSYGSFRKNNGQPGRGPVVFVTRNLYDIIRNDYFVKTNDTEVQAGQLYQCLGRIIDHTSEREDVGLIYVAVPRLGYSAGSSSLYELYKNGDEVSAFSNNEFSKKTNEIIQNVDRLIKHYVDRYIAMHKLKDEDVEFISSDEYTAINSKESSENSTQSFEQIEKDLQNELVEAMNDIGLTENISEINESDTQSFQDDSENGTQTFEETDLDRFVDDLIDDISDKPLSFEDDSDTGIQSFGDTDVMDIIGDVTAELQDTNNTFNDTSTSAEEAGRRRRIKCKKPKNRK